MRLFVAAYPDRDAIEHLRASVASLHVGGPREPGRSVRLQPPERWHVTLAFIGDVPEGHHGRAVDAVREGWTGQPIGLRVAGGGTFGRGRFTVLWAGLAGDLAALGDLADGVRRALRRGRLPYDPKPYRPHLTIARPGDRLTPSELAEDRARLNSYEGPQWSVDGIHLVRSHLGPNPRYETLAVAPG